MKKNKFNGLFTLALLVAMLASVSGCGDENFIQQTDPAGGADTWPTGDTYPGSNMPQDNLPDVQAVPVDQNPYETLTPDQLQQQIFFEQQINMLSEQYEWLQQAGNSMDAAQYDLFMNQINQSYDSLLSFANDNKLVIPFEQSGMLLEQGNSFNLPTYWGYGTAADFYFGSNTYDSPLSDPGMNGGLDIGFNNFNDMNNFNNTMPDMNFGMPGMGW